jgi:hypothetical protein
MVPSHRGVVPLQEDNIGNKLHILFHFYLRNSFLYMLCPGGATVTGRPQ